MARPRSEHRRNAILSAGTRVIASQGRLYVALKIEMTGASTAGLDAGGEPREQVRRMWTQWLRWAAGNPEKRRALAQLHVADDITADSHRTVSAAFRGIADLLERSRASGPMRDAPLGLVLALTNAIADTTIVCDFLRHPERTARGRWKPGGSARPGYDAYATSKQCNLATVLTFAREIPRLRFNAVEPGFNPSTGLSRDANVVLRLLAKYVLSPLAPFIKYWSTPKRAARALLATVPMESSGVAVPG